MDGVVFHSTRTCRAFTGPQRLLARSAQNTLGIPSIFFEGDVADASFYKEEILESRLVVVADDAGRSGRRRSGRWGAVSRAGMQRAVDEALASLAWWLVIFPARSPLGTVVG